MEKQTLYYETLHQGYGQYFAMDRVLFEQKTAQWHLTIFDNARFGRVMALDGVIQTTERDEFIYHEMLTHVPVLAHGAVKSVLIIGGGDGGMLREVVKHRQIERIVMVEIDAAVVEMCKTWLPNHSQGAFDDPRLELVIDDGMAFVDHCQERFDVIISDCTDPVGPGEVLFTSAFYAGCKRCLNDGGIFVAQNGVGFMQEDELQNTLRRMSSYVKECTFYQAAVPTYIGGNMAFAWATDNLAARQLRLSELNDRYVASGINTRYYTPKVHLASFALPAFIETALSAALSVSGIEEGAQDA
ncbi:polyamine aminopropyltransferase [Shewanella sp. NFH-SH190041]|uniref:polyamine aminopropyltransferase n=1 Tax=Shewanella sp. NFH-SH190041 TaxID=2950245 RepID=UPI0021C2C202|nr:polyamine aminopropyltransferase [Shewanella sp. NFH-SH190041]BDM64527.1 polyamine aminopropyltransferase [Shewanella sp. NFH-SH190041]